MLIIKDYGRSAAEVEKVAVEKWTTSELQDHFVVHGFLAPFIEVTRIRDGAKGTLEFGHSPRIYFNFVES